MKPNLVGEALKERCKVDSPNSLTRNVCMLAAAAMSLTASHSWASPCAFVGKAQPGGIEPPLAVNATCSDPDYNEQTLVIDSTEQKMLTLSDGRKVSYTEVKGHFSETTTQAQLSPGILQSPTTARHSVIWRFPEKSLWRGRFFQQTYPLPEEFLNTVDLEFAFANGGYTVSVMPGNPLVGYRVPAAAAKLAKAYARKLYGSNKRIYGYIFGQSGGSVQMMGAAEGTVGVWDGIVPVVIATDGLTTHSFMWDSLYAIAIPEAKRKAIAEAVVPGSGRDPYAGLNNEERAILDEFLRAGFARRALEDTPFRAGIAMFGAGAVAAFDPTYEDDFWSKPGYEGTNPPAWFNAAKVDGIATITDLKLNARDLPSAITFDPATLPNLGSIGAEGLQYYVLAEDGTSRITSGDAQALSGTLDGNTLTLAPNSNSALLKALAKGGRVRVNNRLLLAAIFYPRHSILDNDNPAYDQYRNADGTPKYVQRPVNASYLANVRSSGGLRETGHLKVRTIVIENLADPSSYPYVAAFYASQVKKAMRTEADKTFRIYFNENAPHYAGSPTGPDGKPLIAGGKVLTTTVSVFGVLNQTLLDLANWAERGITPQPSTRFALDAMNQVVVPKRAGYRKGYQPVVDLTVNSADRIEVGPNQPVTLEGIAECPPGAGKIIRYDWYLGGSEFAFEPAVKVTVPQSRISVARTVTFSKPGEYEITLRVFARRDGVADLGEKMLLQNLDRVRVVVR